MDAKYFGSTLESCPVCGDRRLCRDLDTDADWIYRNCLDCGSVFALPRAPEIRILSEAEIAERFPQFADLAMRRSPAKAPARRRTRGRT
ncbi:MAG TPA: hypothetical protein P5572_13080 [Phycisphaerae bacterium]|nr:hypothetical protein [Phycisphaerae bacterium]